MRIGNILIAGEQCMVQPFFVAGVRIQKMQQVIKQADKANKDNGKDSGAVKSACEQFDVVGIINQHIQKRKENRCDKSHTVGKLQQVHAAVYMPVEKEHQKEKDEGQDIARLHAGCLHQGPGGDKALE